VDVTRKGAVHKSMILMTMIYAPQLMN